MPSFGLVVMTGTVNAPVEQVFSFMQEPANTFGAITGGDPRAEISDIARTPEDVGTTARVVFPLPGLGRLGITGEVVNEIMEVVSNRRIVVKSSSPEAGAMEVPLVGRLFKFEGTWTWRFEPQKGGTKLTVDYVESASWPVYLLDKATEKLQTRGFGEAVVGWIESGLQATDVSRG